MAKVPGSSDAPNTQAPAPSPNKPSFHSQTLFQKPPEMQMNHPVVIAAAHQGGHRNHKLGVVVFYAMKCAELPFPRRFVSNQISHLHIHTPAVSLDANKIHLAGLKLATTFCGVAIRHDIQLPTAFIGIGLEQIVLIAVILTAFEEPYAPVP